MICWKIKDLKCVFVAIDEGSCLSLRRASDRHPVSPPLSSLSWPCEVGGDWKVMLCDVISVQLSVYSGMDFQLIEFFLRYLHTEEELGA
jgi:hypothetical protein